MSALGQKQTFECASAMSALPPKADIVRSRNMRTVLKRPVLCGNGERRERLFRRNQESRYSAACHGVG